MRRRQIVVRFREVCQSTNGDQSGGAGASDNYTVTHQPYILDNDYTLSGQWTEAPGYSDPETTFTDDFGDFQSYMVGWQVMANLESPVMLTVTDVVNQYQLKVRGDMSSLATTGDWYMLSPPPGVAPDTGTLGRIDAETDDVTFDVLQTGSRYLWASYRHMRPTAGFYDEGTSGTVGAQTGDNLAGTYYCWNRIYDPTQGRWTTPDPAASPATRLLNYAGSSPIERSDPSGLKISVDGDPDYVRDVWQAIFKICPHPGAQTNAATGKIEYPEGFCGYPCLYVPEGAEDKELVNDVPGHSKGCELIANLLCDCCEVTISNESRNPHYRADNWEDASKKGWQIRGNPYSEELGREVRLAGKVGTGDGSGGTVAMGSSYLKNGLRAGGMTLPGELVLAHELAHALRGCEGQGALAKNTHYMKARDDKGNPFDVREPTTSGKSRRVKINPWKGIEGDPDNLASKWGNREEYDVINEWEHPIAREMYGNKAPIRRSH